MQQKHSKNALALRDLKASKMACCYSLKYSTIHYKSDFHRFVTFKSLLKACTIHPVQERVWGESTIEIFFPLLVYISEEKKNQTTAYY